MTVPWRPPLLLAATLLFFFPLLLRPDGVLYSDRSDLLTETLPAKRFLVREWQQTGEIPLWCPYSYGGLPFVHDMKTAVFYPPNLPLLLLPESALPAALSWLVALHVLAAGLTMYAYARYQGLEPTGALVAGVGFMFAGKWLLHVLAGGHYILAPVCWLPLVLLGLEHAQRRGGLAWAILAGAAFGLIVLGGHPQMTLYAGLFTALWTLGPVWETPRSGRRRAALTWAVQGFVAALTAATLAAIELIPAVEAMRQAIRGGGVASGATLELSVLVVLQFFGRDVGRQEWEAVAGVGALWAALAAVAALSYRGRVRFQVVVAVLCVLFALGLGDLLQRLPGLNLFQIHPRMLLLLPVPLSLLAGRAVDGLHRGNLPRRRVLIAVGTTVVVAGLLFAIRWQQSPGAVPLYWLVLPVTAAAALLAGASARSGLGRLWLALLVVDTVTITQPLVQVADPTAVHEPSACVRFTAAPGAGHHRVLDRGAVFGEGRGKVQVDPSFSPLDPALPMVHEIESLRGFNSVDVKRFKQYLQFVTGSEREVRPRQGLFGFPILANFRIENKRLLDLLGVRYLLQPAAPPRDWPTGSGEPGTNSGWSEVFRDESPRAYQVIAGGTRELPPYVVWENREALPRAFVVPAMRPLPEEGVLAALLAADYRHEVLLEGVSAAASVTGAEFRVAEVVDHQPNQVTVRTEGPGGWLVLADVWFPGWVCRVDGAEVPLHRANYLFRAAAVPSGPCEVVFAFEPGSYHLGKGVSLAALLLVVGAAAVAWRGQRSANLTG